MTANPQPAVRVGARVKVPIEPTPELLHSMAVRYDHGLGIPGYYDQPAFGAENVGHAKRLEATIRVMRQLHEEVVGTGFYRAALTPAPTEAGGARDWLAIAKLSGQHGVRYRTNTALEAFLTGVAALSSTPAADAGWQRPEDTAEQFVQAAVDRAPEPLRRLGEWLASVLDDDDWKTAERMLLGAAVHPADPRDEFELWAGDDNRDLAAQEFEERDPDNFLFYAADSTNQAYIGWYFASRPTPQPGGAR